MKKTLTTLMVLILLSSCSNYYKAVLGTSPANATTIEELKSKNRYFILRDGNKAFSMNNISLSPDQKTLHYSLNSLPFEHKFHLTNGRNGKMKYRKPVANEYDETVVLNEVHIYINSDGNTTTGINNLQLNQIQKIEIIEKDKVKTKRNHTIGTIAGIGGILLITGVITAVAIGNSLRFF